jgi:DNA-binding transcriptional ArsR family regulator
MAKQNLALDTAFQALADPTRRAVIVRLGRGPATVSELAAPFAMALPSFVKHIALLEKSRLVITWKVGRVRNCRLDLARLVEIEGWFGQLRAQWGSRTANLDDLLAILQGDPDDA